jgi:phage shock protein PspC (stress-responsive transcriptional regulator)
VNPRRLYRSADDRVLAGVAGGLAAYLDVDPIIVRIIWFLSVFFTGSLTFWAYLIMIVVVPLEPSEWPPQSPWAPGGAPLGYQGGYTPWTTGAAPGAGTTPTGEAAVAGASTGSAEPGSAPTTGPDATAPGMPPTAAPGGSWSNGWSGNDWRGQRRQERWQRRAECWQEHAEWREYHGYGGPGLVFGLLLVLVGGLLAWHQFDPNFDLNVTWPVVIIAFGAILVASSLRFRNR